jgi:sarcosine oxidase gamma subunit
VSYETSNKALGRIVLLEERIAALEAERDALAATVERMLEALEAGKADRWAATCGNTETNSFAPSEWVIAAEEQLATPPPAHLAKLKARERAAAFRGAAGAVGEFISGHTFITYAGEVLIAMAEAEEEKAR